MNATYGDFEKLSAGGSTVYFLKKKADYSTAIRLLEEADLRPLRSEEILFLLTKESDLGVLIKSRINWFWLAGRGLDKEGIFKTNHRGTLVRIWGSLSGVIVVRATRGSQPLMLGFPEGKSHFDLAVHLAGNVLPDNIAPGIVGVPKGTGNLTKEKPQDTSPVRQTNLKVIFEEVKSTSGVTLHTLKQEADYQTALALLEKAGLELFTPQEIFRTLINDQKLMRSFIGEDWFWVAGKRSKQHGYFAIDDKYNIIPAKRNPDAQARERMVLIRKGAQPLSLEVHPDDCVADSKWPRFCLHADNFSGDTASIVVGKKKQNG